MSSNSHNKVIINTVFNALSGYISHELKSRLKDQDIDLMTYHRKNMQAIKLSKADNYHLKQRNKIETLFSLLIS